MNLILAFREHRHDPESPAWPDFLAWTVCGVALFHTSLLFTLTDFHTSHDLFVQLLYPFGMGGAAVIMLTAAWLHAPVAKRWAWLLQTCSLLSGMARALLLIRARFEGTLETTPITDTLYVLMYIFALSGVALYLPWRSAVSRSICLGARGGLAPHLAS